MPVARHHLTGSHHTTSVPVSVPSSCVSRTFFHLTAQPAVYPALHPFIHHSPAYTLVAEGRKKAEGGDDIERVWEESASASASVGLEWPSRRLSRMHDSASRSPTTRAMGDESAGEYGVPMGVRLLPRPLTASLRCPSCLPIEWLRCLRARANQERSKAGRRQVDRSHSREASTSPDRGRATCDVRCVNEKKASMTAVHARRPGRPSTFLLLVLLFDVGIGWTSRTWQGLGKKARLIDREDGPWRTRTRDVHRVGRVDVRVRAQTRGLPRAQHATPLVE